MWKLGDYFLLLLELITVIIAVTELEIAIKN